MVLHVDENLQVLDECATCGEVVVQSEQDPGVWLHRPTTIADFSVPAHRVVRAR